MLNLKSEMDSRARLQSLPWLVKVSVMTAVYCAAARLALCLAIPPGYATAVWPAAGLALAGILLFGEGAWPGILIGHFLGNFWTGLDPASAVSILKNASLAISIGLGGSLQALIGAFLVKRFLKFTNPFTEGGEILAFILLGGPLSCLTSATVGVTSLLTAGLIRPENYLFNWWTWWVGDTIGVLVFTPLVLIWFGIPRTFGLRRQLGVSLPLIVTFVLVTFLFVFASKSEQGQMEVEFERRTDHLAHTLQNSFDRYVEILYSIKGFYASSPRVERKEFRTFVGHFLSHYPGIQALSYDARITNAERAGYELEARREGYNNFQITEQNAEGKMVRAAERPAYVSVYYIEPHEGNESALGYDVRSGPKRVEALNRARDTDEPVVTGRVKLVQEKESQWGLLIFLPLYRYGLPHSTIEERSQNLQGYVTEVFRIHDVIETSLGKVDREGIRIGLYDESAPEEGRLLYENHPPIERPKGNRLRRTVSFEMAGRHWSLQFSLTPEYEIAHRSLQAWSVLAGGLLFAGLLQALLLFVTGRTAKIEELVTKRTAELEHANEDLHHQITERERIESELKGKMRELEQLNRVMTGREERILQLKEELKTLQTQLGLKKMGRIL